MNVHPKEAWAKMVFFLFVYWWKDELLNKWIIRHQFKCFTHYSVNVFHATHPFQLLKNPTSISVPFERKMPFKKIGKKYTIWCSESGGVSVSSLSHMPQITVFSTAALSNEEIWLLCNCIFEKSRGLNVHVPQLVIFCAPTYFCVHLWRGCNYFQFLQILFRHSFFAPLILLLLW